MSIFAVENGSDETRGRCAGQREAGLCRTFFLQEFRASRSIDVGLSVSYPCKVIPISDEVRLWDKIKKVKTKKTSLPMKNGENSWKPKQACGAPRIYLELSWSEDRSRLARLSGAVAYISLHSTMYTTIIDRQGTCWARFAWKDARPPLFFPTTKWRKKSLNSVTVHLSSWRIEFGLHLFLSITIISCMHKGVLHLEATHTLTNVQNSYQYQSPRMYSLMQWNWFSGVTGCTWISCIQWRQSTNLTASGNYSADM